VTPDIDFQYYRYNRKIERLTVNVLSIYLILAGENSTVVFYPTRYQTFLVFRSFLRNKLRRGTK